MVLIAVLSWQASLGNSGVPTTVTVLQPSPEAHCTLLNPGQSETWHGVEPMWWCHINTGTCFPLWGLVALTQAPLNSAVHTGYRCPSEASLLHLSFPSQPSQGLVRIRLSLVIRHGPATAPGTSVWPCRPIAATPDIDIAPLFCFGCGSAFSGCCLSETFQQNG